MTNRKLIIILAILLGVYLLSRVLRTDRESTFDPVVVELDTSEIDQVKLHPRAEEGAEIVLSRSADGWTATMGNKTVRTPASKLGGLMSQLNLIQAVRVVSRDPERRAQYEVDDQGTRVVVSSDGKDIADFVVGAFKFDQAKRSASSYVRKSGEDEVYLVDGFLSMSFNQGFNTFRDNTLVKMNREDVREISMTEDGERIAIAKNPEDGHWYRGGMEKLDSTIVAQYVSQMTNLTGQDFAERPASGTPDRVFEVTGNNQVIPLRVECYESVDTTADFVIHSTANPESWFLSDSSGLYQRIFQKFEELLTTE